MEIFIQAVLQRNIQTQDIDYLGYLLHLNETLHGAQPKWDGTMKLLTENGDSVLTDV